MENGIILGLDELLEDLALNENRADDAFNNGDWTQEKIDSFNSLYELAQALGYNVREGNKISTDSTNAIKAAAARHGFNLDKFKRDISDDEWFVKGVARNAAVENTGTIARLLRRGVPYECAECHIKEWNGKPISLQLHHIDGDHLNNELTNLQLLCPNCHSQTDTYARNKK